MGYLEVENGILKVGICPRARARKWRNVKIILMGAH
jgi:hypothetical protein